MPSMKSVIERLASMGEVEHKPEARAAFLEFRDALTQGKIRAAERKGEQWIVNAWVKQGDPARISAGRTGGNAGRPRAFFCR